MKKKLILGALALTSILAFAQTTKDESSSTTERKFWGKECSEEMPQGKEASLAEDTTQYCCYYVFWINTGCHWE